MATASVHRGGLPDEAITVWKTAPPIPSPGKARKGFGGCDAGHGRKGRCTSGRYENDLGGRLLLHGGQGGAIGCKR